MLGHSDGSVIIDINGNEEGFKQALSRAGKIAATAGKAIVSSLKAIGAAVGTVSAGITAVGAKIVNEYADYEQLVGGVETLFKDSADKVQQYAENAYKTAGMSANDYMETVTGFSASLIQSLGGDTKKAAEYAQMAITDMSDNANKMGTDMEAIQNAYSGFSKSNFTMLDNLKLGYGGTKEEMERLLADAEKLSGIKFDISSYADIVEAIHIIQEDMDIAGTTAKEAEATISGSIGMLKAAFQNLLAGMGNAEADVQGLIDKVVEAFNTVVSNISPIVDNIIAALPSAFAKISEALNALLPEFLQVLANTASEIIETLLDGINGNLNVITEAAENIFTQLLTTLSNAIPLLSDIALEIVMSLVEYITDNISEFTRSATEIVIYLANEISNALPQLIPAAVEMLLEIANALIAPENIIQLLNAAVEIVKSIVKGLLSEESLSNLKDGVTDIISNIADTVAGCAALLAAIGIDIASQIVDNIVETFENFDWWITFQNLGASISQAMNAGFDSGELLTAAIEKYGGKSEDYLHKKRQEIQQQKDELSAAWEDYSITQAGIFDTVDDYIAANMDNANGKVLAAIKAEAEEIGITGINLGAYIEGRIDELEEEHNLINLAIGNGIHAVDGAGEEAKISVMNGYAENAKNSAPVFTEIKNDVEETTKAFAEAVAEQDHLLATHQITEEQYYKNLGDILTEYEDRSSEEWWKIYDKVDKYNKKAVASVKKTSTELKKTTNQVSDDFKEFYAALQLAKAKGEISDDEYIRQLKEKLNSSAEYNTVAYTSYWNEVTSAEKRAADKAAKEEEQRRKELEQQREQAAKDRLKQQQETANAELEQFKTDTEKLTSEYKSKLSELQKERDSFKNRLSENIFASETVTDKRTGKTKKIGGVVDLQKKITSRKALGKYLESLVKKGIPKGMLSELAAMDPDEGLQFAKQLDSMDIGKWQSLIADYNEYEAVNEEIANRVYGPQITALNEKYAADMASLLDTVTDGAAAAGAETVKEFIKGVDLSSDNALSSIKDKLSKVIKDVSSSISDGSLFGNIDTENVGVSIAEGIANGIISQSDMLKNVLEKALNSTDIMSRLTAAVDFKSSGYAPVSTSMVTNISNVTNNNRYMTAAQGGAGANGTANFTVNLLWKDGTKLAEIVNTANKKIAISTGGN